MLKDSLLLRVWAAKNVPMIAYVRPKLLSADDEHVSIRIPLRRRTKNHLNSMYFGALQVGADVAGGFIALRHAQQAGRPISFVFKDAQAEFLRRAEQDVVFTCSDGAAIRATVEAALADGERHDVPVDIEATAGDEVAARFTLTLSLRAK